MSCTEQMVYAVLIQVVEPKEKRSLKTTEARLQDNIKTDLTETGCDEDSIKTNRGVL
jgi:hypothetical protein